MLPYIFATLSGRILKHPRITITNPILNTAPSKGNTMMLVMKNNPGN